MVRPVETARKPQRYPHDIGRQPANARISPVSDQLQKYRPRDRLRRFPIFAVASMLLARMNIAKTTGIHVSTSICVLLTLGLLTGVRAQPATSAPATSAPATTQRQPYRLTMPPGMVQVTVGDRVA